MSDKINRYSIINAGIAYDINGEWCRAEDVELLEQQNAELLEALKSINQEFKHDAYREKVVYAEVKRVIQQTLAKWGGDE